MRLSVSTRITLICLKKSSLSSEGHSENLENADLIERRADSDFTVYDIRPQRCLNALAPPTFVAREIIGRYSAARLPRLFAHSDRDAESRDRKLPDLTVDARSKEA
jgi:hypothetical protein